MLLTDDFDNVFETKMNYSRPLKVWSDVVGRFVNDSETSRWLLLAEVPHSTQKMRLYVLKYEHTIHQENIFPLGPYTGEVFEYDAQQIPSTIMCYRLLHNYITTKVPPNKLVGHFMGNIQEAK